MDEDAKNKSGGSSRLILNEFFLGDNAGNPELGGVGSVSAEIIERIFLDCVLGLQHTHEKRIFHRDIKPQNIMVADDGTCKLADFGISHQLKEGDSPLVEEFLEGTLLFSPPELETMEDCGMDGYGNNRKTGE